MRSFRSLLLQAAFIALTLPTLSSCQSTLPFAKVVNGLPGSGKNLAQIDRERAQALIQSRKRLGRVGKRQSSIPATNGVVSYLVTAKIGTPPETFSNLIVDTGSSNTWVGAGAPFNKTRTSIDTHEQVEVFYGSGSFFGEEFLDIVSLSPELTIIDQSFGVASNSTGFEGTDGILGIGPTILTEGTLLQNENATIPTVTDNLFRQGRIESRTVGVLFNPLPKNPNLDGVQNGELTFGSVDPTKFEGPITFTPVTATEPSSFFWGINATFDLAERPILRLTSGIVDTGTTLVLIATNAFDAYQAATGSTLDPNTGLLIIPPANFARLGDLNLVVNGKAFGLNANAQLWPRDLNTDIGGVADALYLIVNDIGSPSGTGLDFIAGQTFLERFYSVFETDERGKAQVGFARTPNTDANIN